MTKIWKVRLKGVPITGSASRIEREWLVSADSPECALLLVRKHIEKDGGLLQTEIFLIEYIGEAIPESQK